MGLAYSVNKSSGAVAVYHTDGLGSVRALTDASANVTQTYQTDEFGVPIASGTQGSSTQPFSYTGKQADTENGLSYLRARMYDPTTGRFMQRDTFRGGATGPATLNRYSYGLNSPTTLTDSSGLCSDPGGPGIRYCLEAFIPEPSIGPFVGDNRGPTAADGSFRMRMDIHQSSNGMTVADVTPGVSSLQGNPDIARTADVNFCAGA
jgi:RHS repeat-associated protein